MGANSYPKCGGELLTRKGKYGDFKGCNNYSKVGLQLPTRQ
ncbi:topoisomerase DNA-binding C4 zinc finger domain-containing protein [Desulfosporosinus fructosivorans]